MTDTDVMAREAMLRRACSDSTSAFYKGMMRLLLNCEAVERQSRQSQVHVTLPFNVDEGDVVALEAQFSVAIKVKGGAMRARMTPRVAGLSMLIDSALLEHAGGCGRDVLLLDGDVMTVAVVGCEGRLIERTNATSRLSIGYHHEDEQLRRFASVRSGSVNVVADVMLREVNLAGGEHYWPRVRADGPKVDSIIVNHFKTPVGPKQLAWLAYKRGAVVYGAFPFQVEFLTHLKGRLACFPGWFYVDRQQDVITLVPDTDATMSISHPFSSLMDIVQNNTIVVSGKEFLCEKYNSVRGVLYYTLNSVDCEFEAPEILRSYYYDSAKVGITEISYPAIKLSAEGVPVGWSRDVVRILTSRFEKVLSRVMTSSNDIVTPQEVFTALMDYNNTVVSSLDTVTVVERMDVVDEEKVALAVALHVNWTRHAARGTFNVLMNAIRLRHSVKDSSLFGLAFVALSAWWSRPRVVAGAVVGELPVPQLVDWCGNDFSVVMRDANPWIEIVQMAGLRCESGGVMFEWLPRPPVDKYGCAKLLETASRFFSAMETSVPVVSACKFPRALGAKLMSDKRGAGVVTTVVSEEDVTISRVTPVLTDLKMKLLTKMSRDQGAVDEVVPAGLRVVRESMFSDSLPQVPVPSVDPVSAINQDLLMCNNGPFDRDMVATGYRIAEVEVDKNTEGCFSINDAKRLIPGSRWVRMPKVDAGVEGKRVSSQAALLGALYKRNIGVPSNRGSVDLDLTPQMAVEKVIQVCYKSDWQHVVDRHLDVGLWEPNMPDLEDYVGNLDEKKTKKLLDEFFLEGHVDLTRWMLMAKGKIKASREPAADGKIDHSQTILYLENGSTNGMYSSMMRRFKECVDECLRPEISLNPQRSDEEHEEWYNSLESLRRSFPKTYSYAADIKCYDRSQEHVGLRVDIEFYRRHGLSPERLAKWEQTHGTKKAISMMFGVVLTMVLGGVSGLWKTLFRNGLINLTALVVSANLSRKDVVMLDIKGDDLDAEFSRAVEVETTVERLSLTFNFSAKFFTNDVRYMCKQFRLRKHGRWYFVGDPWAKVQSLCTPLWIGNKEDNLEERWVSLCADLRHYENGILVDLVAEAAQQYYGLERPLYGMARGLSQIKSDKSIYFNFFKAPSRVD